jgi:hypothetical protein
MKGLSKKDKAKIKEELDFKNRMFNVSKDYELVSEALDFGYIQGYRWVLYSYKKPTLEQIEAEIKCLEEIEVRQEKFNTGVYHCARFAQGFISVLQKVSWRLRAKNNMDLSMYNEYDPSFFELWN